MLYIFYNNEKENFKLKTWFREPRVESSSSKAKKNPLSDQANEIRHEVQAWDRGRKGRRDIKVRGQEFVPSTVPWE